MRILFGAVRDSLAVLCRGQVVAAARAVPSPSPRSAAPCLVVQAASSVGVLAQALGDSNPDVRRNAAAALRDIGGSNSGSGRGCGSGGGGGGGGVKAGGAGSGNGEGPTRAVGGCVGADAGGGASADDHGGGANGAGAVLVEQLVGAVIRSAQQYRCAALPCVL